jgi:hypothetical protein
LTRQPGRQDAGDDAPAVERQDRQQVDHHQHNVDDNAGNRHLHQRIIEVARQLDTDLQEYRPAQRHRQIDCRAGGGNPGHMLFRFAQR